MTLEEIKNHMLKYLSEHKADDNNEYYDYTGHCGEILFKKIKNFWQDFNNDEKFKYVVSGEWASDLDLDGGRNYFFRDSEITPLLFDYLKNNLKYSLKQYQKELYNSTSLSEEIEDMYKNKEDNLSKDSNMLNKKYERTKIKINCSASLSIEERLKGLKFINLHHYGSENIPPPEIPTIFTEEHKDAHHRFLMGRNIEIDIEIDKNGNWYIINVYKGKI
jgi:hypothetical protein